MLRSIVNFFLRTALSMGITFLAYGFLGFFFLILLVYDSGEPTGIGALLNAITFGNAETAIILALLVFCTSVVFLLPIKPIFTSETPWYVKAIIIIIADVFIVGGVTFVNQYNQAQYNLQNAQHADDLEKWAFMRQYVKEHKEELKNQYDGCFVLTPKLTTYELDTAYTSMNNLERFNAFSRLDLEGGGAYCVDQLDSF